jgi:hypothetical protein
MSENNNNNEHQETNENQDTKENQDANGEDFTKQVNDFFNKAVKTAQTYGKKAADKIDLEKQKAGIRSEIGHNIKEISAAYEKLGRGYYDAKVNQKEFPDENETIELITKKEAENQSLNEKLSALDQ